MPIVLAVVVAVVATVVLVPVVTDGFVVGSFGRVLVVLDELVAEVGGYAADVDASFAVVDHTVVVVRVGAGGHKQFAQSQLKVASSAGQV